MQMTRYKGKRCNIISNIYESILIKTEYFLKRNKILIDFSILFGRNLVSINCIILFTYKAQNDENYLWT